MKLSIALAAAVAAVSCNASPVKAPVQVAAQRRTNTTGLIRQGLDLAQSEVSTLGSTEIDLEQSWIDDTLFDGYGPYTNSPDGIKDRSNDVAL